MSKDQAIEEGTKKVNELLDERIDITNHITAAQFNLAKSGAVDADHAEFDNYKGVKVESNSGNISATGKDEKFKEIDSQIDASLNKMSEAVKNNQSNTAQSVTAQATETAKVQEQNNDNNVNKAEIENQQSRSKDLQSKIAEVQQQKTTEEQNLNSAKENTKNIVSGLNPEQKEFIVQKLTEQGNAEAVNVINSQPTPQQEAQDSNMIGQQTQEHNDQHQ